MINKFIASTNFLFSFAAHFENVIGNFITKNKLKQINKKISLAEMSFEVLYFMLKNRLTKNKLNFILSLFFLLNVFTMNIQKDRHYRRVTKRPINGWSNLGSFFKK